MLYRQKLADFVSCVANYKEPPHGPKDFYDASNNERWGELETEYCFLKAYIETLQEQSDSLREQLIEEANSMSVQGKKLRLTQIHNKGRIHYDMIPELKTMDLEKYRGTSYITYKISEV